MSILKQKSIFNKNAAEILQEKNLFAPSIHCSYYSCFQLMKVTMNEFFGISYDQLASDIQNSPQSTHSYIINYIGNQIISSMPKEYAIFNRSIKDLKTFREDSDYEDVEITYAKSKKAIEIAEELRKQMTSIFHL